MIKKIIYILILILISTNLGFAQTKNAEIEKCTFGYNFNQNDAKDFLEKANKDMTLFESSIVKLNREIYLHEAMQYYFLLSQANKGSLEAEIGLGRVYDELKMDVLAKKHFFNAYNINPNSSKMNYYFGNFYYKRHDLINALSYYKRAYNTGEMNNFDFYYRMGNLYEKLGDIETANKFYYKTYKLTPQDKMLRSKIYKLEKLNYSSSQYYIYQK